MEKQLPQQDPIAAYARRAQAARRLPKNARCACGESRPEALIAGSKPIICAAVIAKGMETLKWTITT
jgi:hypothetical protein